MSRNRRVAVLLGLFVVAGGYYLWMLAADARSGSVSDGRTRASLAGRRAAGQVEELATDDLEVKPGVYRQGRDLFRYQEAPQPRQPRRRQPPKPPPKQETPVKREPPAPPKAQPPPIDIVYLGSFGRPGRRIAVFSDDESIYNALVGDVIKEKFVLVAIGYESADLGFVGFPEVGSSRLAAGGMR